MLQVLSSVVVFIGGHRNISVLNRVLKVRCGFATCGATRSSSTDINNVPDLHEPAYLQDLKPKIGYHELLNLQLKGYDFVVLEKYQSYLHKTMKKLQFNIVNAWSAPHQELEVQNLALHATAVSCTHILKIYERNIQMKDALVTKLPVLIDVVHMTLPPGISFNIHKPSEEDDKKIYFRDTVLEKLKEELKELKDTPLIGMQ